MKNTSVELATTNELIEELVSRSTFAGVVLCSSKENKGQAHDHFGLYSALNSEDATTLLEIALDALARYKEREHDGTQA